VKKRVTKRNVAMRYFKFAILLSIPSPLLDHNNQSNDSNKNKTEYE